MVAAMCICVVRDASGRNYIWSRECQNVKRSQGIAGEKRRTMLRGVKT